MAKVTSKRQVTIPKAIADRYGIREGDDLEFVAAGDAIRVVPGAAASEPMSIAARLQLFDDATERQGVRQTHRGDADGEPTGRGWTREELYERGRAG